MTITQTNDDPVRAKAQRWCWKTKKIEWDKMEESIATQADPWLSKDNMKNRDDFHSLGPQAQYNILKEKLKEPRTQKVRDKWSSI